MYWWNWSICSLWIDNILHCLNGGYYSVLKFHGDMGIKILHWNWSVSLCSCGRRWNILYSIKRTNWSFNRNLPSYHSRRCIPIILTSNNNLFHLLLILIINNSPKRHITVSSPRVINSCIVDRLLLFDWIFRSLYLMGNERRIRWNINRISISICSSR